MVVPRGRQKGQRIQQQDRKSWLPRMKQKMYTHYLFWIWILFFVNAEFLQPCPKICLCKEGTRFVNCSGVSLSGSLIFPPETEHLDLSSSGLSAVPSLALRFLWKLRVLLLCRNNIAEVGRGTFHSLERLQKLDISGNMITVLGSSFSAGLNSLLELSLSHNRIQTARFRSFQNFENLQKLNIQNNNISSIETGAFRSLTRLRQLHLQNNQLLSLQNGVFSMLQHLEVLNLEGNRIKMIGPSVFTPLSSLTILNLEHNDIEHIRFKTFLTIQTAGTHILLSDNPWFCDCDLQRVFAKLHSIRRLVLDHYENMTCTEPAVLRNIPLASVDTQLCAAETATVLIITFTVFVTVVAAVVMAERNRRRRTGKHWSEDNELSYSIHG